MLQDAEGEGLKGFNLTNPKKGMFHDLFNKENMPLEKSSIFGYLLQLILPKMVADGLVVDTELFKSSNL